MSKVHPSRLGVSLSSKDKLGNVMFLSERLNQVLELGTNNVQIDLRHSNIEDLGIIHSFAHDNPQINLSVHTSTPKLDSETGQISNKEVILKQISAVIHSNHTLITIHAPAVKRADQPSVNTFASFLSEIAINYKNVIIGVENRPIKDEALFGENPKDFVDLISLTQPIGITLDIDHAKPENLDKWIRQLSDNIIAVHIAVPSEIDKDSIAKFNMYIDEISQIKNDFPIYLESKQSWPITKKVYEDAFNILKSLYED
jgi:hypothetical protein